MIYRFSLFTFLNSIVSFHVCILSSVLSSFLSMRNYCMPTPNSQPKLPHPVRPTSLNLGPSSASASASGGEFQLLTAFSNPIIPSSAINPRPQPSSQVYNYLYAASDANINNNNGTSNINSNTNRVYEYVSPSPGIDSIRNMDIFSDRSYFNSPTAPAEDNLFYSGGNDNNNFGQTHRNYAASGLYSSYAASYSSALSESLAETPGVSVAPIGFLPDPVQSFGPTSSSAAHCKLEVSLLPSKWQLLP